MIHPTATNPLVSVVQVVLTSDERDNVTIYQDGRRLGVLSLPDPDTLVTVLRQGGAEITDLRAADISGSALTSI